MEFHEYTRMRRKRALLTLQDVADELGFSDRSLVSKRKLCEIQWQFEEIIKLAELYGEIMASFAEDWELQKYAFEEDES